MVKEKKEFEANVKAEWGRADDEYDKLRRIQNSIIDESAYIRKGLILGHLRGYWAVINEYYDWLRPYIRGVKGKGIREDYEKKISEAKEEIERGYKNTRITGRISRKLWKAFDLLKEIQRELDDLKIKKNMGIKVGRIIDSKQQERDRMKRAAGI